jgi:hypothetical protein
MKPETKIRKLIIDFKKSNSNKGKTIRYPEELKKQVCDLTKERGSLFTSSYLELPKGTITRWVKELGGTRYFRKTAQTEGLKFREIPLDIDQTKVVVPKKNSSFTIISPNGFRLEIESVTSENIGLLIKNFAGAVI